jgi:hypothetical protein
MDNKEINQEIIKIYNTVLKKRVKEFERTNPPSFEGLAILYSNFCTIRWYKDHLCFLFSIKRKDYEFHLYYDGYIAFITPIKKNPNVIFLRYLKKLILEII